MTDTTKNNVPDGFILLQTQNGAPKYAACMTGRLAGWLMKKYPDGNWVSERKLTNLEVMQAEDQRDDGIVHETPAATIQEPVMVSEPLDMVLPCDIKIGVMTIRKGCKLRTLVTRAESLHRMLMEHMPPPTLEEVAAFQAVLTSVNEEVRAPMVADPAGVIPPEATGAEEDYELAVQRGWNNCRAAMLAATVKAVPSEALEAIHGLIAVAGAAYHLMDNTEESGPVGAGVFKHQEDDNAYLSEALDQLDALPDDQPGYVMGPCAKAEWALRHILAAPLSDKTGGGE